MSDAAESLAVYFSGMEQCSPGHSFGPAVRPHYLIHVILKGKGIYICGKHTYHLKAGDAFLISPMESTYYQADDRDPWVYAWAGFDGIQVKEYLKKTCFRNSCVFFCKNETTGNTLSSLIIKLYRGFLTKPQNSLFLQGLLLELLSTVWEPALSGREDYTEQYLRKAVTYINNNYSYPIQISDVAAHTGIDRTYLYRIFMEKEHISPKHYLLRLRLRTAAKMLASPGYTITEVALSCGFRDASSFCNQFKKYILCTPGQYRERIKLEETAK